MKKLTVLVDMDDTLENLTEVWIEFLNETHGSNVRYKEEREWDMTKSFPSLTRRQVYAPLHSKKMWKMVKPLPGAVEYLERLIKDGHKVVVVTASHADSISKKLNLVLFKYFPFISMKDVIVTSQKQLIVGDIMIDDAPHNLVGGKYKGLLMNAPHNSSYDESAEGFIRVYNWREIYEIINAISEGGD